MSVIKRIFQIGCFLLIIIFLHSCVREEFEPYIGKGESKLIVIGFISPGEKIHIYVGKSQPFGKDDYTLFDFKESEATVIISNLHGLQHRLLPSATGTSVYSCSQIDFPIVAGETYKLTVQSSLGEITAETIVPQRAATWKDAKLSGLQTDGYHTFSGTWHQSSTSKEVDYGVSIMNSSTNIYDRINEGITVVNENYMVKREVYLSQTNQITAVLLTRDKAFGDFSRKSDLTLEVIENLNSAGFTDAISGFKGLIPNSSNVKGGLGAFGSYLKDVRKIRK